MEIEISLRLRATSFRFRVSSLKSAAGPVFRMVSPALKLSPDLPKKFYDFTIRGGIIESTGGVGFDYNKGPFGIQFEAFDFADQQRPHLKAMGTVNVTKSIYLLGGVDDFIAKGQTPDWFFGAGLRFVDDDIKSLFGAFSMAK